MFRKNPPYSFQINLPPYTAREVINWFEQKAAIGVLSDEIIGMVFDNLNSVTPGDHINAVDNVSPQLEAMDHSSPAQIPTVKVRTAMPVQSDFSNSLLREGDTSIKQSVAENDPVTEEAPNFLDNLYDWESSNEAVFNEELSVIPLNGKKKMLSV